MGGHLGRAVCNCVVVERGRGFVGVLGRSAVLRRRKALWSEPRSIAIVDSQSLTVFQNLLFAKM